MKKLYYFAYGSNMLRARLQKRVGAVQKVGTYELKGYELVFNTGSRSESYANIIKSDSPDDFVEGVLYELTDEQMATLDRYEGYPYCYQKWYTVFPFDGNLMFMYAATDEKNYTSAKPSFWYLATLIGGADENGLMRTKRMLRTYAAQCLRADQKVKKKKQKTDDKVF